MSQVNFLENDVDDEYYKENLNKEVIKNLFKGCNLKNYVRTPYKKNGEWIELSMSAKQFLEYDYNNLSDEFYCANTFINKSSSCNEKTLFSLNAIVIDLDFYKLNKSQEQALAELSELIDSDIIPLPSTIISSGNGLYLYYNLTEYEDRIVSVHKNALSRFKRVQERLVEKLKNLGADRKALDPAHVFRIPGSINSKNGNRKKVEVLSHNNTYYTLDQLLKLVKPIEKTTISRKSNKSNLYKLQNNYSRSLQIASMIEKLYTEIRKTSYYKSNNSYSRERALFVYRNALISAELSYEDALEKTLELNSKFANSLKEKEVIQSTKSRTEYKFKNKTLIEFLEISKEEQEKLEFYENGSSVSFKRYKRQFIPLNGQAKKEYNKQYYIRKIEKNGDTLKKNKIEERRQKLEKLYASRKYSNAEIAKMLDISLRTFTRDLAFIRSSLCENTEETKINNIEETQNNNNIKETKNSTHNMSMNAMCFCAAYILKAKKVERHFLRLCIKRVYLCAIDYVYIYIVSDIKLNKKAYLLFLYLVSL